MKKEKNVPYRKTQAIVLSRSDYRDNDSILTLFSPDDGRVDVLCRGCRKPRSPLMNAAELFTMGEFVLFSGKGHEAVHACTVIESFYPLRLDYTRLRHAALMASACLKTIQPGESMGHLYILLARSLKRLAYEELDPEVVTTAFLLHFVTLSGFKPRLNHCSRCGNRMGEEGGFLLAQEDGICCLSCGKDAPKRSWLSKEQLQWLRLVLALGLDKMEEHPAVPPVEMLKQYTEAKLESGLRGF